MANACMRCFICRRNRAVYQEAGMNKKTWDLCAPIYKRAMKADQKIYDFMYERIPEMVKDKDVLATDYSDGMIAEAKKGVFPAFCMTKKRWN